MFQFVERVQQIIWNRRFFLARGIDGKILYGLCPPTTKETDTICILFGCSVPVLLRKRESNGKKCYTLIGECYVHGMMDGEALTLRSGYLYSRNEEFILI
jgi:hypothetical protein